VEICNRIGVRLLSRLQESIARLKPRIGHENTISDVAPLGNGVYELEKGSGGRKPRGGDLVKLQLGGIQTASTFPKFIENVDVS
jgi:hypothetical protein